MLYKDLHSLTLWSKTSKENMEEALLGESPGLLEAGMDWGIILY